jgi:hypothetical protein
MLTPHCTRPYSEVAGFEHLLRYKTQNAGCCKILLHPRWGSSCYPATIFTTAPVKTVRAAIHMLEREGERKGESRKVCERGHGVHEGPLAVA